MIKYDGITFCIYAAFLSAYYVTSSMSQPSLTPCPFQRERERKSMSVCVVVCVCVCVCACACMCDALDSDHSPLSVPRHARCWMEFPLHHCLWVVLLLPENGHDYVFLFKKPIGLYHSTKKFPSRFSLKSELYFSLGWRVEIGGRCWVDIISTQHQAVLRCFENSLNLPLQNMCFHYILLYGFFSQCLLTPKHHNPIH